MPRRPQAPRRLGAPAPTGAPAALLRALSGLTATVRASVRGVRTAADARALGVALRKAWPDARIRAIVRAAGVAGERHGSRAWAPIVRAASAVRDSRMRDTFVRGVVPGAASSRIQHLDGIGWCTRVDARKPREYDGTKLVDAWTREATSKITSVRDEVAERLRKDVIAAAEKGLDPAELAAGWIREGIPVEFGTLEGRMRVIAQHQLSVLHASVQSERARAVGVTEYVWRTQQDERVRDEHRALEGVKRSYAESPRPGEPVNCRCYAESVISDELAESLGFGIGVSPSLAGARGGS